MSENKVMGSSKIVRAKDIETGVIRLFLEYVTKEEITYRNFKRRTRTWGRKYGPYHTIKQEAGQAIFYDGGKLKYNVEVLEVVQELEHKDVGVGYGNVDRVNN